jgi:U3 small nucleolar RNA-associated protein 4
MSGPRSVHTVRFFAPPPSSAHCLSYYCTNDGNQQRLLALSRANNDIEVWNMTAAPFLQKWIPGNSESSVEALAWAKGRLFSTGLHGLVLEHDLNTLGTRKQFAVTSGPAWCMSYHAGQNRVAVGTEEGYVCLFEVTEEGLLYDKVLDKQEGRIMCLAWHSSGNHIVTGENNHQ